MARINLRDYYPFVQEDSYIEVSPEIADMLLALERAEESYERKVRRYKAYYSLDHKNVLSAVSCSHLTRRRNCMREN